VTFSVSFNVAPRPAEPGDIPAALATIYVDFDAGVDGSGTALSPRKVLPGLSAVDASVQPGTRVVCRGAGRSTTGNFGRLQRAGSLTAPVVYVGNDPNWGQAIIDGGVQLSPAACVNQADAFGNTNWASLRRASITGLGGNNQLDYLHCAYAGTEREPRMFSGYPQLSDADAFNYLQFAQPASWADVIWKPGSADPTALSDFVSGASRPRILLSAANTAMGLSAGTLQAAIDTDCAPILLMRVSPNVWYTALCRRCDADGAANTSGAYLTPILPLTGQAALVTGDVNYANFTDYAYRILNVAKAIDRAGQYAMNPVGGWMLDWPSGSETLHRSRGNSGLRIDAEYVWVHGFQICGMARSLTVTPPTGATNGDSLSVGTGIDSSTIRVQRNHFPGFGSIGTPDGGAFYDRCGQAARYFNTYQRTFNIRCLLVPAITSDDATGADIRFNLFHDVAGGVSVIGGHVRDVLIGGNLFTSINDIHGNGLTLYANKYGVRVVKNVFKSVDRPIASEGSGQAYDEASYGPASTIFDGNVVQASGIGTAAALRLQSSTPAEIGVSTINNKLDGGVGGDVPFSVHAAVVAGSNGPTSGNSGVGAALSGVAATLWATGDSVNYTRASGEGVGLIAEINATTAPPGSYAPSGVGHAAGGWGG
jgi:hypothetical protein